jgi:hypothetical protein
MVALAGNLAPRVDGYSATKTRLSVFDVIFIDPAPSILHYKLAMFDDLDIRYFWVDTVVTTINAPTPAGTYDYTTLTVQGSY